MRRFINRSEAGRELGALLQSFAGRSDVTVVGLLRGGVAVAYEIAERLDAPLEIFAVRKLVDETTPPLGLELDIRGRTVIVAADGLATGTTMQAAVLALRQLEPARIVVAAPVASREAERLLRSVASSCVIAYVPTRFYTAGLWYEDFTLPTDAELATFVRRAARRFASASLRADGARIPRTALGNWRHTERTIYEVRA